jgi:hypothetical protein
VTGGGTNDTGGTKDAGSTTGGADDAVASACTGDPACAVSPTGEFRLSSNGGLPEPLIGTPLRKPNRCLSAAAQTTQIQPVLRYRVYRPLPTEIL